MKWPDICLLCFAIGTVWSVITLLLGGLHFGHGHALHGHVAHTHHGGHHASGHGAHSHASHAASGWFAAMINPSSLAVFLAWFGGVGYLLTRHTGLLLGTDLLIAVVFGLLGAWLLAAFLRFLQMREQPLDPADYEMVGVLGRVSSTIRPDGVGELIYTRDGVRKPVCARSEDGSLIGRDTEVIVTRFEKGIAFVRTWDAMVTQPESRSIGEASQKDKQNVD
jgi:membrane protein implicated in regulation of membrane protease activity